MDDRTARIIANTATLEELKQFEANAHARAALSDEVKTAISMRAGSLCRAEIAEKIGLDFSHLSPAEEKIVQAVSEYVALKKRKGRHAERTLGQLKRLGLIGAAEASVSKSKPTQGFSALVDADLEELSYEQIVVDHPEGIFGAHTLVCASHARPAKRQRKASRKRERPDKFEDRDRRSLTAKPILVSRRTDHGARSVSALSSRTAGENQCGSVRALGISRKDELRQTRR